MPENLEDHSRNAKAHLRAIFNESSERALNGFFAEVQKIIRKEVEREVEARLTAKAS